MKERIRTLIVGIIIGALLVPTAFATVGTVTKELSYNNIKITLDGKEITPTDASGAYVEPFIMDGTTYLPVRGIANALDLGVEWDGGTNTVKLSSEKTSSEPSTDGKTKVGDVIYDMDGVKVTLTGIVEYTNVTEYNFLVENTTDYIVQFEGQDISINDFMLPYGEMYSGEIQPKKKAMMRLGVDTDLNIGKHEKMEINTECNFFQETNYERVKINKSTKILNF